MVSEIKEVYAYFGMSESDFLKFTNRFPGKTIDEKIKGLPPVELQLADKSIYPYKGKIELMEGQFDRSIGGQLRSVPPSRMQNVSFARALTGKIRIPEANTGLLPVPQTSTYEIQDKIFVFTVGDSNKVVGKTAAYRQQNDRLLFSRQRRTARRQDRVRRYGSSYGWVCDQPTDPIR